MPLTRSFKKNTQLLEIKITEYCNMLMRKFPANPPEVFKNRMESSIKISSNKVLQRDKGTELHNPLKALPAPILPKLPILFHSFPNAN